MLQNICCCAATTRANFSAVAARCQADISSWAVAAVPDTSSEVHAHLAQVNEVARPLGLGFLGLGMSPKWSRSEIPLMPKGRYRIMTAYMPKVGTLGLDMMYR